MTFRFRNFSITGTEALVLLLAGGAVAAGLAFRIAIAWLDLRTLTIKVLPDDAFYYFETAYRAAHGQNITFDGTTVSNGYHPLWLFFLMPFYFVFSGKSLPLHLALTASSILDAGTGILVGLIVWQLTRKPFAALFALTFYLLLPQNIFAAVNGVESAVAALMVAALLFVITTGWRREQPRWVRWSIITGVAGGFMVLSRLDTALLFASALTLIFLFQRGPVRWQAPLIAGAIAVIVVSPWLIWSAVATGSPTPVSATSTTYISRQIYMAVYPDATTMDKVRHGLSTAKYEFLTRAPILYFPSRRFSAAIFAGIAFLIAHYLVFARGKIRRDVLLQAIVPGLPLLAYFGMLFFNASYRWSVREWYYAWGMPAIVCFAGVLFAYLDDVVVSTLRAAGRLLRNGALAAASEAVRGVVLYGAIMVALVLAFRAHALDRWRIGIYPFQRDSYNAALYLRANTPPDARIASFNAGVIGYFSERSIVNIDGVVNPDAYQALRDHKLLAYLRRENVSYAADYDLAWFGLPGYAAVNGDWSKSFWGEDPNQSFSTVTLIGGPQPGFFGQMHIFHLEK